MNFKDMSISARTMSALDELGYIEATEVQEKAIPLMLQGEDVIVRSQTGTGKTAAFGIGLIELISKDRNKKGLILAPTRELALQITKELRSIASA
ncbi:MAG: DEAD/DEAH box helicase, partial [Nitrososphaera sp.]|nr:DEAD/DEAH box helicase [Nitrososphaera sp.]